MKNELLKKLDSNVIIVDWQKGAAGLDYFEAQKNLKAMAKIIANFISQNRVNPKTVHCVGHSLGAHACGFVGKNLKIARITGLDPAGPWYENIVATEKLNKNDADIVDVLHTDWKLGHYKPLGHRDFYPNGGTVQPGCTATRSFDLSSYLIKSDVGRAVDLVCSHSRALLFFTESINSVCPFTSIPCPSYSEFKSGRCTCSRTFGCARMGYHADNTVEQGSFFLKT